MADYLDRLGIRWEYEPTLFVITDRDGTCSEGFRPDFYLPDHDIYIEVTQAKVQTRKNGKLRRFRAAYPGVEAHLFTRTDFDRPLARITEIMFEVLDRRRAKP